MTATPLCAADVGRSAGSSACRLSFGGVHWRSVPTVNSDGTPACDADRTHWAVAG
jgi:hypothetical protein